MLEVTVSSLEKYVVKPEERTGKGWWEVFSEKEGIKPRIKK